MRKSIKSIIRPANAARPTQRNCLPENSSKENIEALSKS